MVELLSIAPEIKCSCPAVTGDQEEMAEKMF